MAINIWNDMKSEYYFLDIFPTLLTNSPKIIFWMQHIFLFV